MSSFDNELTLNNFTNNSPLIECSKCISSVKYIRCSCCNEKISLSDFVNYININNGANTLRLTKSGDIKLIRISVYNLSKIVKYLKSDNASIYGLNFNYNLDYLENNENATKIVNNISIVSLLDTFKLDNLPINSLLIITDTNNNLKQAEVLINIDNLLIDS